MPLITRTLQLLDVERTLVGIDDGYLAELKDESEAIFREVCEKFLPDTGALLDIGANIGVTAIVARTVKPRCSIIAVEAAPGICAILHENLVRNAIDNVEIYNVAAGSEDGSVPFFENSAYGHMLIAGKVAYPKDKIVEVPVVRPGDIVGKKHIDVVKIDVEGFERTVIEGCSSIDERDKPIYTLGFNAWALSAYGRVNPMDFLDYVKNTFREACYFDEYHRWVPISEDRFHHILHRNMRGGLVDNFVCTNREGDVLRHALVQ